MIIVNVNYPVPHFTVHDNPHCTRMKKDYTTDPRLVRINKDNLISEIEKYINHKYMFKAEAGWNHQWIEIDLGDKRIEKVIAWYILELLGKFYTPLRIAPRKHDCTKK